jgi:hypothetical protein
MARKPSAREQLLQIITARWIPHAISAAAKLGIADHLPATDEGLAAATRTDVGALGRLLRALEGFGFFVRKKGQWTNGPLGELLRRDAPGSLYGVARMFGEEWHVRPWMNLGQSLRTGASAFEATFGGRVFDYFTQHPEAADVFHRAMIGFSATWVPAIVEAYDFSKFRRIIDVGGGFGTILAAILRRREAPSTTSRTSRRGRGSTSPRATAAPSFSPATSSSRSRRGATPICSSTSSTTGTTSAPRRSSRTAAARWGRRRRSSSSRR